MPATAAELQRLSALLDEALDLDAQARQRWLDGLELRDGEVAGTLRRLLAAPADRHTADLLDRGPAFVPPDEPDADTLSPFAPGDRVGPWRLLRLLGRGGMGEVWLAERADGALQRPVALKLPTLAARRALLVQRFARERDIVAGLAHPHIARLYDAGTADDGQPYLALEYVEGEEIDAWCRSRAAPIDRRVALLRQVMDAVQYAHAHLVIHRDLKPGNVLVDGAGRAMLLDFGIAKLLEGDAAEGGATELTQLGGRAMSLHHAAPEQIRGEAVSTATDVWALGVLLHELAADRRPFEAAHRGALEQAILGADPPRLLAQGPLAPLPRGRIAELGAIVAKALRKAPAERYATVAAFADDVDRWQRGDVVLARPDSRGYRLRKFLVRHRVETALAAGVATVVVGAAGVALLQARIAREQAATAEAVQAFLEGILRSNSSDQADPQRARSRTALELLDEGAQRIDGALDDVPRAKLRVLKALGEMFNDLADPTRARAMLDRRIAVAQAAGEIDEMLAARIDRALVLTDEMRFDDARAEIARVREALGASTVPPPRLAAGLHLAESVVRTHSPAGFSAEQALADADRAIAAAATLPDRRLHVAALRQRAVALSLLGRPGEVVDTMQRTLALVRRDPAAGRGNEVGLLWELADAQADLGDDAAAERSYREAQAVAAERHGRDGDAALWSQIVFVRFLVKTSRLQDAGAETDRAVAMLAGRPPGPERRTAHTGLLRFPFQARMRLGRFAAAEQLLAAAEADAAPDTPDPESSWYRLQRRAWLATERGELGVAARTLAAADALVAQHGLSAHAFADAHEALRLRLAIARGDGAAALAAWSRWQPMHPIAGETALRADHAVLAAGALLAAGDADGARRRCASALARLAADAGRTRQRDAEVDLHELHGRALLAAGDFAAAAAALQQAEVMAQALLDADAPRLARIRSHLGLARLAAGDRDAARRLAEAAGAAFARAGPLGADYREPWRRLRARLDGTPAS